MAPRTRLFSLVMVTAVLGAACSSSGEDSSRTGGGTAARPKAERLTIAVPTDQGPLNLFSGTSDVLLELVYDKLLAPSPYVDDPQPWLAEEISSVDPSTWMVTLRDDVTWHDGKRLTVEDVKFTFEYFRGAASGRHTHHVSEVPDIVKVEIVGEDQVRFSCSFACPELGEITLADLPIIPRHIWEGVPDPSKVTALPVGTGPYRLVAYDPVSGYRFEANADYFAGAPVVDELVMPVIEDPSATFTALRTGEIDAAARPLSPELLEEFKQDDDLSVATTAPLQFLELRMNFERTPLDVPELRHAFSLAVDREEMLEVVGLGDGRPATTGYPHPDSPWTNPDLSTPYDTKEAASVLDELGYVDTDDDDVRETPEGDPLAFSLKVNGAEPTDVRAAELVAEQLGEIGIDIEVETIDAGTLSGLFRTRDFDLALGTISAHGVADPTQFIMSHRSGYLWSRAIPYPEWDELFEQWKATTTVEDRTEVLFAMQELFNRQPTSIPLLYPAEHWAYRQASFTGWVESPSFGIVNKWSFLAHDVGTAANAITQEIE
jgi:peptide/nickel transport system substrate-binding protein